jgi:hypothetical protein
MPQATACAIQKETGFLGLTHNEMFAERRLWLAVIKQAVEDWRSGTLRARRSAEQFVFDQPGDFEMVCANAGLDANHLRSQLLRIGRKVAVDVQGTRHSMAA